VGGGQPAQTPTEARLAALWQAELGVEPVGREDGFAALGGHSLAAARLAVAIEQAFGVPLAPEMIFEADSLAGLALIIDTLAWAREGSDRA
jgi:acyl carrier protein